MPAIWIPKRLVEIGLINTAAESAASFACHCEIEYESRVDAAAREAIESGARVIMLTGPSASGKTTTAHKIAAALTAKGHKSKVISLDNFFKNIDKYPHLPDGSKDYENVTALDAEEFSSCINMLISTGEADLPEFDFVTETRKQERMHISLDGGIAVVEGIHALNPALVNVIPADKVYKIYAGLREEYSDAGLRFLATRDIRLARRMVRDYKFRGHSLEKTLGMWNNVCMGEDKYIKVYKPSADLLMDTSFSYEICCLAPFVTSLKGVLPQTSECAPMLNTLIGRFEKCSAIQDGFIPQHSMLREFIGI
ncbi:MAG: adenylyl-sulfate kinase [Oscillospiraceae bacterium]